MRDLPQGEFEEWKMHTRRVHDHQKAECDICHKVFKNKHPCNVHRTMVKMSGLMSDLPFLQDFEEWTYPQHAETQCPWQHGFLRMSDQPQDLQEYSWDDEKDRGFCRGWKFVESIISPPSTGQWLRQPMQTLPSLLNVTKEGTWKMCNYQDTGQSQVLFLS